VPTFELLCLECNCQILVLNDDEAKVVPEHFLCPNCASTGLQITNFYRDSATTLAGLMADIQGLEDRLATLEGDDIDLDA